MTAGTIQIGSRAPADSIVYNTDPTGLVPLGTTIHPSLNLRGTKEEYLGNYQGIQAISLQDPAVGTALQTTVPTGQIWRILTFNFAMSCSSQVANRQTSIQYVIPTSGRDVNFSRFWQSPLMPIQTANSTSQYRGVIGYPSPADAVSYFAASSNPLFSIWLPDILLQDGWLIGTNTASAQSLDAYTTNVIPQNYPTIVAEVWKQS